MRRALLPRRQRFLFIRKAKRAIGDMDGFRASAGLHMVPACVMLTRRYFALPPLCRLNISRRAQRTTEGQHSTKGSEKQPAQDDEAMCRDSRYANMRSARTHSRGPTTAQRPTSHADHLSHRHRTPLGNARSRLITGNGNHMGQRITDRNQSGEHGSFKCSQSSSRYLQSCPIVHASASPSAPSPHGRDAFHPRACHLQPPANVANTACRAGLESTPFPYCVHRKRCC
jgi:hypothetical protein